MGRVVARDLVTRLLAVAVIVCVGAEAFKAVPQTKSLSILIQPGEERCVYIHSATVQDHILFTYLVRYGNTDFDVHVKSPDGATIFYSDTSEHDHEGKLFFLSRMSGEHAFCLSNNGPSRTEKLITVNVAMKSHARVTKKRDPLLKTLDLIEATGKGLLERQAFLRARERDHRDTLESNNVRVLWRGVLEIAALIGLSVGQVFMLKRLIERKQRRTAA